MLSYTLLINLMKKFTLGVGLQPITIASYFVITIYIVSHYPWNYFRIIVGNLALFFRCIDDGRSKVDEFYVFQFIVLTHYKDSSRAARHSSPLPLEWVVDTLNGKTLREFYRREI